MKKQTDDDYDEPKKIPEGRSAQRIPQHKHCMICHKAIPAKEKLCSDECQMEFEKLDRKRRSYMYIMYGLFFVIIIFVMLSISQGQ